MAKDEEEQENVSSAEVNLEEEFENELEETEIPKEGFINSQEEHLEVPLLDSEFSQESPRDLESLLPKEEIPKETDPTPYEISNSYETKSANEDVRYAMSEKIVSTTLDNDPTRSDLMGGTNNNLFVERDSGLVPNRAHSDFETFEEHQKKYEMERHEESSLPFRREKKDRDISFI